MLSKKQAKLINRLDAKLPKGADMYFDKAIVASVSETVKYLSYVDLENEKRILPIDEEELAFIMRESNLPTFYTRTFPAGEKLFLVYDSKSNAMPKEIEVSYPYRRQCHSKCYSLKELQQCPKEYLFLWETQNKT